MLRFAGHPKIFKRGGAAADDSGAQTSAISEASAKQIQTRSPDIYSRFKMPRMGRSGEPTRAMRLPRETMQALLQQSPEKAWQALEAFNLNEATPDLNVMISLLQMQGAALATHPGVLQGIPQARQDTLISFYDRLGRAIIDAEGRNDGPLLRQLENLAAMALAHDCRCENSLTLLDYCQKPRSEKLWQKDAALACLQSAFITAVDPACTGAAATLRDTVATVRRAQRVLLLGTQAAACIRALKQPGLLDSHHHLLSLPAADAAPNACFAQWARLSAAQQRDMERINVAARDAAIHSRFHRPEALPAYRQAILHGSLLVPCPLDGGQDIAGAGSLHVFQTLPYAPMLRLKRAVRCRAVLPGKAQPPATFGYFEHVLAELNSVALQALEHSGNNQHDKVLGHPAAMPMRIYGPVTWADVDEICCDRQWAWDQARANSTALATLKKLAFAHQCSIAWHGLVRAHADDRAWVLRLSEENLWNIRSWVTDPSSGQDTFVFAAQGVEPQTGVSYTLETVSWKHIDKLLANLGECGKQVVGLSIHHSHASVLASATHYAKSDYTLHHTRQAAEALKQLSAAGHRIDAVGVTPGQLHFVVAADPQARWTHQWIDGNRHVAATNILAAAAANQFEVRGAVDRNGCLSFAVSRPHGVAVLEERGGEQEPVYQNALTLDLEPTSTIPRHKLFVTRDNYAFDIDALVKFIKNQLDKDDNARRAFINPYTRVELEKSDVQSLLNRSEILSSTV